MSLGSQNFIFSSRGSAELWNFSGKEVAESEITEEKNYFVISTFEGIWKFFEITESTKTLRPSFYESAVLTAKILDHSPTEAEYQKNFSDLEILFQKGDLKKIVLARKTSLELEGTRSVQETLDLLFSGADKETYLIAFKDQEKTFFSKTPERLLSFDLKTGRLETEALAGTRGPHAQIQDFQNPKDQEEHGRVLDFIVQTLQEAGAQDLRLSPQEVLTQKKLSHLRTRLSAQVESLKVALKVAKQLHPTPAVGGWPQATAREWIKKIEGKPRTYYAAPMGLILKGSLELCVALRSGFISPCPSKSGQVLELYAGSGLVPLSQVQSEWDELNLKLSSILSPIRVG